MAIGNPSCDAHEKPRTSFEESWAYTPLGSSDLVFVLKIDASSVGHGRLTLRGSPDLVFVLRILIFDRMVCKLLLALNETFAIEMAHLVHDAIVKVPA